MPLKLFWWKRDVGRPNFGDELGRLVVEELSGRRVEYADLNSADLVTIGSLLAPHLAKGCQWHQFRGTVWGTGRMYPAPPLSLPAARIAAVRGTLTRAGIGLPVDSPAVLGDPGLLADRFVVRPSRPLYDLGVVPHWTEQRHPAYRQGMFASPQVNRIDVLRSVREVLQEIASCRTIAASSLHGLVVADALGIPNVWVRAYPAQVPDAEMPAFKYQDYYSVFGIFPKRPVPLTGSLRMDQLEPYFATWQRPGLGEIRKRLLAAFPFSK